MTLGFNFHIQTYRPQPSYHRFNAETYCLAINLSLRNLFPKVLATVLFFLAIQISILVIQLSPNTLLRPCGGLDLTVFEASFARSVDIKTEFLFAWSFDIFLTVKFICSELL